ncbi:hypothetical protein ABZ446_28020 [Streptomyces sp. NPDC005813]|uniref:hypothetical protein n=1 Tax=Streptomyces sp. NPDC005813 TaxID=3155592 RepID=UPI0033FA7176
MNPSALIDRRPPPPRPTPLLARTLTGFINALAAMAISPDGRSSADLLRATVDSVLHGAAAPHRTGIDDERLGALIPADRDDDEEVSP